MPRSREVGKRDGVKIVAVSNEGRELMMYRQEKFSLANLFDFLVVSSVAHFRKPDSDIYRIALDGAQPWRRTGSSAEGRSGKGERNNQGGKAGDIPRHRFFVFNAAAMVPISVSKSSFLFTKSSSSDSTTSSRPLL